MIQRKMAKALWNCFSALTVAASILIVGGCVPANYSRNVNRGPTRPGLYGLEGWQWGRSDIDGEVGHPLSTASPHANCVPGGNWSANVRIVSGQLPPGMTLNPAPWTITGLPTERGHWIVRIELYDVKCGAQYYQGITQELRFHITGSGKVVN